MKKKNLHELIEQLRKDPNVVYWHEIEPQEANTVPMPDSLDVRLKSALEKRGIASLYTHQAAAYEAVRNGKHIVAVTPTASGKTLCYNLPVLQAIAEAEHSRALYLFPTKALAQDQKTNCTKSSRKWACRFIAIRTMATPPQAFVKKFARRAILSLPIPICFIRQFCRIIRNGYLYLKTCAMLSSMSSIRIAACLAAMLPTSSAA